VAYSFFIAGVASVLVGLLYLAAFRIRYSKLLPIILLVYVGAISLPQGGHLLMLIMGYEGTVEQLFSSLTLLTGSIIFGICMIIFVLIGYFAVDVKKNVPVPR
jgi:hypothetical protein